MARKIAQGTSANVHVGPLLNISASVMVGLTIDNDAIILIQEGGSSAARSDTTSAASIAAGVYRVVLNASDTATMGELDILVSGSGAILWVEKVEVINANTWALFYGSADNFPTSALVAGLSATIANVSVAVAGVSAAVAGVSAAVAGVSGAVAGVSAALATLSANISGHVNQALTDYDVPTSADVSVMVSVGVNAALGNYGVPTSAAMSAAMSAVGVQVLTDYDVPTSADISAIGSVVAAQALSDYAPATSANVSVIVSAVVENAVWQRALTEPTGAPTWTSMPADVAIEWVVQRNLGQHHQASTSVATYNSAGTQIASASVNITSTSANQDRWIS